MASSDNAIPNQLNNIDFKINADKAAVIIIELASASSVVDMSKSDQGLNIELLNTKFQTINCLFLDVSDFATVVETIEVFRQQSNGLLEVKVKGDYQYDYQLNKNVLEVVIRKSEPQPKKSRKLC